MPELTDLPNVTELATEITNVARDAAYVAVGLGVLGFQKAQVQRVELKSKLAKDYQLDSRVEELRAEVLKSVRSIDEIVEGAFKFVESTLEPLEDQLPATARDLAKKGHEQARPARTQIRGLVVPA